MAMDEAPPFWWTKAGWQAWGLSVPSWLYGRVSARRMNMPASASISVPVVCIGNFIAGGAGKTPTTIALAKKALEMGLQPGVLSRGHGGGINVPTIVELGNHDARDVGDEPLLLAETCMTVVAANRIEGARLLVENGAQIIFMDDGFQNPTLHKDFSIAVVDARRGVGNGFVHPAGPIRVPLSEQMPKADTVLVIGEGEGADKVVRIAAKHAKPVQLATVSILDCEDLRNKSVIAFAGIADPEKFYASLRQAGATIMDRVSFGDHHQFRDEEIQDLINRAKLKKLALVTTAKDFVRLPRNSEVARQLASMTRVAHIELQFEDPKFAERVIDKATKSALDRSISEI